MSLSQTIQVYELSVCVCISYIVQHTHCNHVNAGDFKWDKRAMGQTCNGVLFMEVAAFRRCPLILVPLHLFHLHGKPAIRPETPLKGCVSSPCCVCCLCVLSHPNP